MRVHHGILSRVAAAALFFATLPRADASTNLTGLPTYPHLDTAAMDDTWRTESLGRWCARFTGATSDPLDAVEAWYRRTLSRASELDLARDERFKDYPALSGIKLVIGVDYVVVYRMPDRPTILELHLCGAHR